MRTFVAMECNRNIERASALLKGVMSPFEGFSRANIENYSPTKKITALQQHLQARVTFASPSRFPSRRRPQAEAERIEPTGRQAQILRDGRMSNSWPRWEKLEQGP